MGSPPRVRGTVYGGVVLDEGCGITPACAGNRKKVVVLSPQMWDHPRVCGEQYVDLPGHIRADGSPPRVRGTVAASSKRRSTQRITPACAGNSTSST